MDKIEKMITGDPKDEWLFAQEIRFTDEQLEERWFSVITLNGGSVWCCESNLILDNNI